MTENDAQPRLLVAATVGAARGLRGEVTLEMRTDQPERRFGENAVLHTDSVKYSTLTVEGFTMTGGKARAYFTEIRTREDAEAITGVELFVEEKEEEGAWYPHELVGLPVEDPEGRHLGTVLRLQIRPAQDLLEVDSDGQVVQVPFVEELVPVVDTGTGRIVVDAPSGLFDADTQEI